MGITPASTSRIVTGHSTMYRSILTPLLLVLSGLSFAQTFTYAPINISGAVATEVRGINNSGEVVGFYYTTKSCVEPPNEVQFPNCNVHGFKIVNGTVVKLMVLNAPLGGPLCEK